MNPKTRLLGIVATRLTSLNAVHDPIVTPSHNSNRHYPGPESTRSIHDSLIRRIATKRVMTVSAFTSFDQMRDHLLDAMRSNDREFTDWCLDDARTDDLKLVSQLTSGESPIIGLTYDQTDGLFLEDTRSSSLFVLTKQNAPSDIGFRLRSVQGIHVSGMDEPARLLPFSEIERVYDDLIENNMDDPDFPYIDHVGNLAYLRNSYERFALAELDVSKPVETSDPVHVDYDIAKPYGNRFSFLSSMWGSRPGEGGDVLVTRSSEPSRIYRFPCVESALRGFMATLTDRPERLSLFETMTGPEAVRATGPSGIICLDDHARATWDGGMRDELLDRLTRLKFDRHPDLAKRLSMIHGGIVGDDGLGDVLMACRDELVATDSLSLAPTAAQGRERVEAVTRQKAKDAALDRKMRDCMPEEKGPSDEDQYT